jgi:hypothetical protein
MAFNWASQPDVDLWANTMTPIPDGSSNSGNLPPLLDPLFFQNKLYLSPLVHQQYISHLLE